MKIIDIVVPDLGNFAEVPVIDVLVKPGETVEAEAPIITLETDKAAMDVPAPVGGRLTEILVVKGAKVSKGTVIARIEAEVVAEVSAILSKPAAAPTAPAAPAAPAASSAAAAASTAPAATAAATPAIETGPVPGVPQHAQVLVLGAEIGRAHV